MCPVPPAPCIVPCCDRIVQDKIENLANSTLVDERI